SVLSTSNRKTAPVAEFTRNLPLAHGPVHRLRRRFPNNRAARRGTSTGSRSPSKRRPGPIDERRPLALSAIGTAPAPGTSVRARSASTGEPRNEAARDGGDHEVDRLAFAGQSPAGHGAPRSASPTRPARLRS